MASSALILSDASCTVIDVDAGVWIRAVRRARRLSQRELAALAGVPQATISRAEAGRGVPRLETFFGIIGAAGYGFALLDRHGRALELDPDGERIHDRAGRHFPAHLDRAGEPDYIHGSPWWGWHRIAFWPSRENVPEHTYWRRAPPRPPRVECKYDDGRTLWMDAT